MASELDCDSSLDTRMGFIAENLEILELVIEQRGWLSAQGKSRQRQRRPGKLLSRLFEVIEIKVTVAASPDEITDIEVRLLRDHVRQQGI